MGLGSLVKEAAASKSIRDAIKERFVQEREVPPITSEGWLRVSSLPRMCAREEVICARDKVNRTDKIDAGLNLIFSHGTALHYIMQNQILPELGVLRGIWRCISCSHRVGGAGPAECVARPASCPSCDAEEFVYQEAYVSNPEFRVGGHPDGFLVIPGMPSIGVLEIKSISSNGAWKVRHVPDMSHVIQLTAYLWLTGLKWGVILYWDKGAAGMSGIIEHMVERDENTVFNIQDSIRAVWGGIRTIERGEAPVLPDRVCDNGSCPRATRCAVPKTCFGGS